jgi:hypothetical protein
MTCGARGPILPGRRKPSSKNEPTDCPEFAVRRETISRFFSPPLPRSTFHDFVSKGKIIPLKGIRGFYKLNDSLRRLGLREVAKLPEDPPSRTTEDIIRLAFHSIDPEVFPSPSWLMEEAAIDGKDAELAELVFARHAEEVTALGSDRERHHYLQGVLDGHWIKEAEAKADGDAAGDAA